MIVKLKFFYLSLLLHALLFLCALSFISKKEIKKPLLNQLQTFVYQKQLVEAKRVVKAELKSVSNKSSPLSISHAVISIKQKADELPLIRILHDLIAEKQSYPEAALALNQSGKVKIGFMLHPNGELTQINLEKSSGYASLDSAALAAVNAIGMVDEAQKYIQQTQYFAIDVDFVF